MIKLYAALLNKKLVLAIEEANLVINRQKRLNTDDYRCPHCHKKVILVISQTKSAFFKHWLNYQNNQGEKEEHHSSKMLLKAAFTALGFPAQTEIPLANGQLRADVLVSPKLALEVQCAPLSDEEFQSRHYLYRKINILDLWIVGKRHYLQKKIRKAQLIFLRKNKIWGNYYLEVDPYRKILRLKFNILRAALTNEIVFQTAIFTLDEIGIKKLLKFRPIKKQFHLNPNKQKQFLWRQIHEKTKFGKQIAEKLYQLHLTVNDLPEEVFSSWREPHEIDQISKFLKEKS